MTDSTVVEVLAQCEAKLMRLMDSVEGEQPAADGTDPNASGKMLASQVPNPLSRSTVTGEIRSCEAGLPGPPLFSFAPRLPLAPSFTSLSLSLALSLSLSLSLPISHYLSI